MAAIIACFSLQENGKTQDHGVFLDLDSARLYKPRTPLVSKPLFHNPLLTYQAMTRTSIEACAKAFVIVLFLLFLYSVYRVAGMIGWV